MARKKKSKIGKTTPLYRQKRKRAVPQRCFFCEKGFEPLAGEFKILEPFLTRRGKIRGRKRSGLCSRHQRQLAKEMKRARNLGFLPFKIVG